MRSRRTIDGIREGFQQNLGGQTGARGGGAGPCGSRNPKALQTGQHTPKRSRTCKSGGRRSGFAGRHGRPGGCGRSFRSLCDLFFQKRDAAFADVRERPKQGAGPQEGDCRRGGRLGGKHRLETDGRPADGPAERMEGLGLSRTPRRKPACGGNSAVPAIKFFYRAEGAVRGPRSKSTRSTSKAKETAHRRKSKRLSCRATTATT